VADLGAGSGNLTKMLLARGCSVDAVESCDAMRVIGEKATGCTSSVRWVSATGTMTTLSDGDYDWVTWGSSFNVVDRLAGLQESYRLLKPGGFF
jgi:ubiquinone/menaquinone biosynthesis C-methylase UbiE